MKGIFVEYVKVANDAFGKIEKQITDVKWEWVKFKGQIDSVGYLEIDRKLSKLLPFDFLFIADIFWKTGQNICRWCKENNIQCYFLQHGQWIYTKNKTNPKYLPFCTFFFCPLLVEMVGKWPYGKKSSLKATGTPRYDFCDYKDITTETKYDYIYFSPPVIYELYNYQVGQIRYSGRQGRFNPFALNSLEKIKGIDQECQLLIHPHYREGNINILKDLFPSAIFKDPLEDPLPFVEQSKKILTHRNSTSVLDAISNGKISILMNFLSEGSLRSSYPRGMYGEFALESKDTQHLINNLKSRIEIDTQHHYIERAKPYIYLGNASKRIMSCIMENHGN